MVVVPLPVHVQPVGRRAPLLAFHSGRVFAGSRAAALDTRRTDEFRRMVRDLRVVRRQTIAAWRRTNDGRVGPAFAVCLTLLLAGQLVGQSVGIVGRSAGASARHLE